MNDSLSARQPARTLAAACATVAAAFGVLALFAPAAHATLITTDKNTPADGRWQGWADQTRQWLPAQVTLVRGGCGEGNYGEAGIGYVCIQSGLGRVLARWTFHHELGHTVDFAASDAQRQRWIDLRGWSHWRPERFADDWAECGERTRRSRRLRRFCATLRAQPELVVAEPDVVVIDGP